DTIIGNVTEEASLLTGLLEGTPVSLGGGDGSVSALGAGMLDEGDAHISLGTCGWFSIVTKEPLFDKQYRITTEAHVIDDLFCPNGTTFNGTTPLKWFKEILSQPLNDEYSFEELTALAKDSPPGANGLTFLPFLQGEKSPYILNEASGSLIG